MTIQATEEFMTRLASAGKEVAEAMFYENEGRYTTEDLRDSVSVLLTELGIEEYEPGRNEL